MLYLLLFTPITNAVDMDHNHDKANIAPEATQGSQLRERFNPQLNHKSALLVLTGVILLGILAANLRTDDRTPETVPQAVSGEKINLSVQTITGYSEVVDAAVTQDEDRLSLVLVVEPNTSVERAQALGDNFVRQVKLHGPDSNPSKEIGDGEYDYLVGVYSPDETLITQGIKAASSDQVRW